MRPSGDEAISEIGAWILRPSMVYRVGSQIAFERYTNEEVGIVAEDGDIWIERMVRADSLGRVLRDAGIRDAATIARLTEAAGIGPREPRTRIDQPSAVAARDQTIRSSTSHVVRSYIEGSPVLIDVGAADERARQFAAPWR